MGFAVNADNMAAGRLREDAADSLGLIESSYMHCLAGGNLIPARRSSGRMSAVRSFGNRNRP